MKIALYFIYDETFNLVNECILCVGGCEKNKAILREQNIWRDTFGGIVMILANSFVHFSEVCASMSTDSSRKNKGKKQMSACLPNMAHCIT